MTVDFLLAAAALGAFALAMRRDRSTPRAGESARWASGRDRSPLVVRGAAEGRLVLGTSGRALVAADRGHSVIVVGPTQSMKTSGFAVPAILEWHGPVLAASVKADLAGHTIDWRRRQGDVSVFDPTRSTTMPTSSWSPLQGVTDWSSARRIAHVLTAAARPAVGSMTDGDFWYSMASKLIAPLLLAASCSGRDMADVVRWVDEHEQAEVTKALLCVGADVALRAAQATWWRDERQRSAVYSTAESIVDAYGELPAASSPGRIDPKALLSGSNTLYLCAPASDQRRLQPLFTMLATEVLDAAYSASMAGGAPVDPPLLVVIDEAANVAPLAELDTLASTAAGHGVQLVTVWQDLAQITARYGVRGGSVVNNHRAKVFLSGIADPGTLEHASTLIGDTKGTERVTTVDGRGTRSTTMAPFTRRLAPADLLRRIPPGHGVVVCGHLPPMRIRLRSWWADKELRRRADIGPGSPGRSGRRSVA